MARGRASDGRSQFVGITMARGRASDGRSQSGGITPTSSHFDDKTGCISSTKNRSRFLKRKNSLTLKQFAFLYGKLSRFS